MRMLRLAKFSVVCAAALLATVPAFAQEAAATAPPKPHIDPRPRFAAMAKWPDFSGVWSPDWAALFQERATPAAGPKFTPEAAKKNKDFIAAQATGENTQGQVANCIPPGVPGVMRQPYPIEFVYSPDTIYILLETYSQARRVYIDGRKLPDDPDLWFNGHSIGHWEGDALIVETIGLNPKNVLQPGLTATEQTRLREKIWLASPTKLMIETTITDPTLFTQPFVSSMPYLLKTDWEMREYICAENNKDAADEFGRPSMNLD